MKNPIALYYPSTETEKKQNPFDTFGDASLLGLITPVSNSKGQSLGWHAFGANTQITTAFRKALATQVPLFTRYADRFPKVEQSLHSRYRNRFPK